jgi:DNA processing protein
MEAWQHGGRQDALAWLRLRFAPGVGSVRFARLLEAFGSPQAALAAPEAALAAVRGVGPRAAAAVAAGACEVDPEEQLRRLERLGGRLLAVAEADYPPLLREIFAPPPLLFVRGSLEPAAPGGVAVVGSRRLTPYGRRVAAELGRDLGRAGTSVVSGLARGIDSAAHAAALAARGHTTGVLGCGLDVAYPPENAGLMEEMAAAGAVVSEFPLGTPPAAANFPVRNRVISGLSRAVVVVEAGLKSGALITARHALDQGREVFAVPGPVGSAASQGCHELIRQGARLLSSAAELAEPGALPPGPGPGRAEPEAVAAGSLPPDWRKVLEAVSAEAVHVDLVVRESGLKPQEVTAILVSLEMEGLVEQRPGKYYVRL